MTLEFTDPAHQKSLPAPAKEEPAAAADEDDEQSAAPAKHGKNLFRKLKSSAAAAAKAVPVSEGEAAKGSASAESAIVPSSKGAGAKSSTPSKQIEAGKSKIAVPGKSAAPCPPKAIAPSKDLLELLGGDTALAAVVHGFYEKIAADRTLSARFGSLDMTRQGKAMQSFLTAAIKAGSRPVSAPGHQWLSPKKGLNDDDFNKCLSHFEAALHARLVPEGTIFRALAVFERYRESVVD